MVKKGKKMKKEDRILTVLAMIGTLFLSIGFILERQYDRVLVVSVGFFFLLIIILIVVSSWEENQTGIGIVILGGFLLAAYAVGAIFGNLSRGIPFWEFWAEFFRLK